MVPDAGYGHRVAGHAAFGHTVPGHDAFGHGAPHLTEIRKRRVLSESVLLVLRAPVRVLFLWAGDL